MGAMSRLIITPCKCAICSEMLRSSRQSLALARIRLTKPSQQSCHRVTCHSMAPAVSTTKVTKTLQPQAPCLDATMPHPLIHLHYKIWQELHQACGLNWRLVGGALHLCRLYVHNLVHPQPHKGRALAPAPAPWRKKGRGRRRPGGRHEVVLQRV